MWIAERKSGKYYEERVVDPVTGTSRTVSVKIQKDTTQGRKSAREDLLEKMSEKQPSRLKLSDMYKAYLAEQEITVCSRTYRRNMGASHTMLKLIGDPYLDKLSAGWIRTKLLSSGKSASTLNECLKRLKSALRWGYQNDFIEDIAVIEKLRSFDAPSYRSKIENKYLEKEDLQKLLEAMTYDLWRMCAQFMALSGLRPGEALALDWEDISDGYIHVHKTVDPDTGIVDPRPKTDASVRDVAIQPELEELVRKIHVYDARVKLALQSSCTAVFIGDKGTRARYPAFLKYLKETAKIALDRDDVTPHIFRHTHASLLAESGVPLDVISRRLGHENSDITRKVYLHVTKNRKISDAAEISRITLLA